MRNRRRFKTFRKARKSAWLALRLLPSQKQAIRLAAGAREMCMSEYMIHLHERAIDATGAGKRDA
jgi:uncharacterized protein (DUF1778 family)